MTSKEERAQFLAEMEGVQPIRRPDKADVDSSGQLTPGQLERRRAAVERIRPDLNPLTETPPEALLGPQDLLEFKRPGIQHGVYRKLRLGQYPIQARLDLHRHTVAEARRALFRFIREAREHELRCVLVLHGKGERNPDRIAVIKSHLALWLPQLEDVMAFHSAQRHHGGSGAVYIMLRKSARQRQDNRERFGV